MLSAERVSSALNFLTCEGVNYYPDGCYGCTIEVLISDYLNECQSDDENSHRNEGKIIMIKINTETIQRCIIIKTIIGQLSQYIAFC